MRENLCLFIKGIIIGIGKILPGVSGSVLAISLGVYERLLSSINNIIKDFKNNFKYLVLISLGIGTGILITGKILNNLISKYPMPLMFLFAGLIIGSMNKIIKELNLKNINIKNLILFLISFLSVLIPLLITKNVQNKITTNPFLIILLGSIDSLTSILPGISGTAILIMIGYYSFVLNSLSNPFQNIRVILLLGIGFFLTTIIMVKIINYLINKYHNQSYYLITGFTFSSLIVLVFKAMQNNYTINILIISLILMIIGIIISLIFEKDG